MATKRKSIARLTEDAAALLQKLVKLKAADDSGYCRCVTCGKVEHWRNMDGGHFISRTYRAHKLREENIHPQCQRCNRFRSGEGPDYTLYMIDTYGRDFVDELIATKREPKKYTRPELEEMIEDLKDQISELEGLCGFC